MSIPQRPTNVRFQILTMATVVAFIMYLDRICLAQIVASDSFKKHINLSQGEIDWVKGAFFWAYALAQVPAGMLSDRFGARTLITIYIATWSIFTAATSFAFGFWTLLIARLGCGLAEAGYYPASSGLLTRWSHVESRGMASSAISWGGRVGAIGADGEGDRVGAGDLCPVGVGAQLGGYGSRGGGAMTELIGCAATPSPQGAVGLDGGRVGGTGGDGSPVGVRTNLDRKGALGGGAVSQLAAGV